MAYVYESIQNGVVKFTIPGKNTTVTLFRGNRVTVEQKLTGGYLRLLTLVEEIADEPTPAVVETKTEGNSKAKVADKITKVEEVVETVVEEVKVAVEDTVATVTETEVPPAEVVSTETVEEKAAKKTFKKR
jgi:hypothetical protein